MQLVASDSSIKFKMIIVVIMMAIITSETGQVDPWSKSEWTSISLIFLCLLNAMIGFSEDMSCRLSSSWIRCQWRCNILPMCRVFQLKGIMKGNMLVGGRSWYCKRLSRDSRRTWSKILLIRPILQPRLISENCKTSKCFSNSSLLEIIRRYLRA